MGTTIKSSRSQRLSTRPSAPSLVSKMPAEPEKALELDMDRVHGAAYGIINGMIATAQLTTKPDVISDSFMTWQELPESKTSTEVKFTKKH